MEDIIIKYDDNFNKQYKEYLENEVIPNYKKEQKKLSGLLGNTIIPFRPELGYYIRVNGDLEISEKAFPEEYKQIVTAFNSFLSKL